MPQPCKCDSDSVKPRPRLFRALGDDNPPPSVKIAGKRYLHLETFKHDSWAATAVYQSEDQFEKSDKQKIVCKFNRTQPVFGVPMRWLGRWLAKRESQFLDLMRDCPNVPNRVGDVLVGKRLQTNVTCHEFISGKPFQHRDPKADRVFFRELRNTLAKLHDKNCAYVDLHKAENVIMGDDRRPYLIDFQISFQRTNIWLLKWLGLALLTILTASDQYHLRKHRLVRYRARIGEEKHERLVRRPIWIKAHRAVAIPLRKLRRHLLILLYVRSGDGYASSEHRPEKAFQSVQQSASLLR